MRRLSFLAGASVLSLALGCTAAAHLTTHAPPPAVTLAKVVPNGDDAADIAHAKGRLLNRLDVIARRNPYGTFGPTGRDFVSAWSWSYAGRAAVRLYALTKDTSLLDGLLAAWRRFDEAGEIYAARDGYGWYTGYAASGSRHRDAPIAGLIVQPIVDLLLEAERDPQLASQLGPARGQLLRSVERALAGLESLLVEYDGETWLMNTERRGPEPANLMAAYAIPMLGLARLTGERRYAEPFSRIAKTFRASWRGAAEGRPGWPYFAAPPALRHKPDPIHKTPGNVELVMAGFRAGIAFDAADLTMFTQALNRTILVWQSADAVSLRWAMDEDAGLLPLGDPRARRQALQLGSWYVMACAEPQIAAVLDRLLPALDPDWRSNSFVLAGRAEYWLMRAQPERCHPNIPPFGADLAAAARPSASLRQHAGYDVGDITRQIGPDRN